jgi:hypothetical protein
MNEPSADPTHLPGPRSGRVVIVLPALLLCAGAGLAVMHKPIRFAAALDRILSEEPDRVASGRKSLRSLGAYAKDRLLQPIDAGTGPTETARQVRYLRTLGRWPFSEGPAHIAETVQKLGKSEKIRWAGYSALEELLRAEDPLIRPSATRATIQLLHWVTERPFAAEEEGIFLLRLLGRSDPLSEEARRSLIDHLAQPRADLRVVSAESLSGILSSRAGQIEAAPLREILAALILAMRDEDARVRQQAYRLLEIPISPALSSVLEHHASQPGDRKEDLWLRYVSAHLLRQQSPDAPPHDPWTSDKTGS